MYGIIKVDIWVMDWIIEWVYIMISRRRLLLKIEGVL